MEARTTHPLRLNPELLRIAEISEAEDHEADSEGSDPGRAEDTQKPRLDEFYCDFDYLLLTHLKSAASTSGSGKPG